MALVSLAEAVLLLQNNEVVALPTETVYGLAAKINSDEALGKIFSTKNRPFFDPLIVHVSHLEQGTDYAEFDPLSMALAQNFWPGPLTLILPKRKNVSDLITSGGATVALRSPNHPVFLETLATLQTPLAAPSANMFGKTSPTTADHVLEEFSQNVAVVNGGTCSTGIESTIVEINESEKTLEILRPGIIDQISLQKFLYDHSFNYSILQKKQHLAPGHLKNHYQPDVPFILIHQNTASSETLPNTIHSLLNNLVSEPWEELQLPHEASLAARQLYSRLRLFSKRQQAFYFVLQSRHQADPTWSGLIDRLMKASSGAISCHQGQWQLQDK